MEEQNEKKEQDQHEEEQKQCDEQPSEALEDGQEKVEETATEQVEQTNGDHFHIQPSTIQQQQQVQEPQDDQEIDIVVTDPVTKESNFNRITYYSIKGRDAKGSFEVSRRFAEFFSVREAMVIRWPGCFVPRLPAKKLSQGSEKKVIENRLKFLNAFCQKMSKRHHLFYSTEFNQIFLRGKEQDIQKIFSGVSRYSPSELIHKYSITFPNLKPLDQPSKILKFQDHIKKSLEMLRNYKAFVRESVENQDLLNQQLTQTFTITLQDYEKQALSQYVQNQESMLIFSNPQTKEVFESRFHLNDLFKGNNIQIFFDLIRLEIKECKDQAYQQQLAQLQEYEKRKTTLENKYKDLQLEFQYAMQGKTGFKNMFSKGTLEDQKQKITAQQNEVNQEIEQTKIVINLIAQLISNDIDAFQSEKQSTYQQIMKTISDLELAVLEQQFHFWKYVQQQSENLLEM